MLRDKSGEFLPVLPFVIGHQIILIGQWPPQIRHGWKSPQEIVQVYKAVFHWKPGKTPPVIGMEQNQISLNSHGIHFPDTRFQRLPISSHRFMYIPFAVRFLKRIRFRFIVVEIIVLREHAESNLIERRFPQRLHSSICQCPLLMHQRIYRGAERPVPGTVVIFKMSAWRTDHSVRNRRFAEFLSRSAHCAPYLPATAACRGRIKANLIDATPGIKAPHSLRLSRKGKFCLQIHQCSGTLRFRSRKCQFKGFILPHVLPPCSLWYHHIISAF